jgi:hypothetical protein
MVLTGLFFIYPNVMLAIAWTLGLVFVVAVKLLERRERRGNI